LWAYAAVWPDYLYAPNQSDNSTQIPELFTDSQVLTLAQMPGGRPHGQSTTTLSKFTRAVAAFGL